MALCLSRKVGESVVIGGEIRVTVSKSKAGRVTLAIEAPRDIPVDRGERYDAESLPLAGLQPVPEE